MTNKLSNNQIGALGQSIAVKFLIEHGYKIIMANIRVNNDEIDILAARNGTFSFIEVKTRTSKIYEKAEYHFSTTKLQRLKRSALAYSLAHSINEELIKIEGIAIDLNLTKKMANIKHFINLL